MMTAVGADVARHIEAIDRHGYTVLENVLPLEECRRIEARLNSVYRQRFDAGLDRHPSVDPKREQFVFNLHNKDAMFLPLIDHPLIHPIMEHFLDPTYILTYYNARATVGGCEPQHFHIDCRVPFPTTPIMMQAIWMINDFSIENGATRVIPGSHKWSEAPQRPLHHPQEISVTGKAGSVFVGSSSLWHGAGPSKNPAPRWGLLVFYGRWFIKPSMDFTKNTPQDVYARLTPRQKKLLGFNSIVPHDENVRINTLTPVEQLPDRWPAA